MAVYALDTLQSVGMLEAKSFDTTPRRTDA
jgi:hypothetical protein